MHHPAHDIQVTQEPNLVFGFSVLFFGTLAVAWFAVVVAEGPSVPDVELAEVDER